MLTPGIVHIGTGAFFRAHLALYTDEAMKLSGENHWGIIAASLFHGEELAEQFKQHGRQYRVLEIAPDGSKQCKTVDTVLDILPVRDNRKPLIEWMSREQIKIVSLTITEKGYCLNQATGELELDHPLIKHDIENPDHPQSAIGILAAALKQRHANKLKPFAILSCDNLPDNGLRLRKALLGFIEKTMPELTQWFEAEVKTPCSMVDRIVPAVTDEALQQVKEASGIYDPCAVVTEQFRQWIIEDQLDESPAWHTLPGVQLVKEAKPYETMKLRMLNGSHSLIAYLGTLAGYSTVADAVNNKHLVKFLRHYMLEEAASTLSPLDIDLEQYAEDLLCRFANQSLQHKTIQIATDGSQKIPQRWLQGLALLIQKSQPYTCTLTGIAAWFRFLSGKNDSGQSFNIEDPLADEFAQCIRQNNSNSGQLIHSLLSNQKVFQPSLSDNQRLIDQLDKTFEDLSNMGTVANLKSFAGS